jgi:hypothetical protein
MTLYLPESLRWLAWIAGASWPDGDEDAMWDISADWRSTAKVLTDLIEQVLQWVRGRPAAVRWCGHQTVNSGSTVTNGAPTTICVLAEPLSPRQMRSRCNPSAANPNVSDRRTWRDR